MAAKTPKGKQTRKKAAKPGTDTGHQQQIDTVFSLQRGEEAKEGGKYDSNKITTVAEIPPAKAASKAKDGGQNGSKRTKCESEEEGVLENRDIKSDQEYLASEKNLQTDMDLTENQKKEALKQKE